MNKHIIGFLLALLVSSGAFAQDLVSASPEAEAIVTSNIKNGKHYTDGLIKHYIVEVDASPYAEDDTHYLTKTSTLIKQQLGYPAVSFQVITSDKGERIARFTFSGDIYNDLGTIKDYMGSLGFKLLEVKGTLHAN